MFWTPQEESKLKEAFKVTPLTFFKATNHKEPSKEMILNCIFGHPVQFGSLVASTNNKINRKHQ